MSHQDAYNSDYDRRANAAHNAGERQEKMIEQSTADFIDLLDRIKPEINSPASNLLAKFIREQFDMSPIYDAVEYCPSEHIALSISHEIWQSSKGNGSPVILQALSAAWGASLFGGKIDEPTWKFVRAAACLASGQSCYRHSLTNQHHFAELVDAFIEIARRSKSESEGDEMIESFFDSVYRFRIKIQNTI